MKKHILSAFILLFVLACDDYREEEGEKGRHRNYYGYWVSETWTDSTQIFRKSFSLDEEKYGFGILPGGKFIEKKIVGWCATPPVVYGIYEGNWVENPDEDLIVETPYWGGKLVFKMEFIKLEPKRIEAKFIYE